MMYSLAYLTAGPVPPAEAVRLAAKHGYGAVGLRLLPSFAGGPHWPLLTDKAMLRETTAALRDTGIVVFDCEIILINAAFSVAATMPFLELCGELGAKAILVGGDDADEARLTSNYAAFCKAAAPFGLTADLEFMPWLSVKDARTAFRIVEAAAQPNAGILVDAIHAARSTTSIADLQALPRHLLHYVQMCDGVVPAPTTTEGLIKDAREGRLAPGEGGFDLASIFGALPRPLPISLEVPGGEARKRMGADAWCGHVIACARKVFDPD